MWIKKGILMFRFLFVFALLTASQMANASKPKTVIFPDMVTKSPLVLSQTKESKLYQQTLSHIRDDGISTETPNVYPLFFQTNMAPKSKYHVQIPTTGEFKLVVKAGERFTLVDNNATDGTASITLPQCTFNAALQIQGPKSPNSKLDINDQLYHVKDTLNTSQRNKWMSIGLRPIPVPTNWHSEDGNDFVLRFKNQDIQSFNIIWKNEKKKAPFPPGINEIGPEGGVVELPGVCLIKFAAGDIKKPTVFSIKQKLAFSSWSQIGGGAIGNYVGPIVSVFPIMEIENYKNPKEQYSTIQLNVDKKTVESFPSRGASLVYFSVFNHEDKDIYPRTDLHQLSMNAEQGKNIPPDVPFILEKTGLIIPVFSSIFFTSE